MFATFSTTGSRKFRKLKCGTLTGEMTFGKFSLKAVQVLEDLLLLPVWRLV
jgi:hypothetical protein